MPVFNPEEDNTNKSKLIRLQNIFKIHTGLKHEDENMIFVELSL